MLKKSTKKIFFEVKTPFLRKFLKNIKINRYEKQKSYFVANYTRSLWRFLSEKKEIGKLHLVSFEAKTGVFD